MIRQPERVIVGTCPTCIRVLVVENNRSAWPYVECACGWGGATTDIANRRRFERGVDDVITGGGGAPRYPAADDWEVEPF